MLVKAVQIISGHRIALSERSKTLTAQVDEC